MRACERASVRACVRACDRVRVSTIVSAIVCMRFGMHSIMRVIVRACTCVLACMHACSVFGSCLMNGSNHLDESERRPFAVCPCDLRKLEDAHRPIGGLDLVQREAAMLDWFEKSGLSTDAALSSKLLAVLSSCGTSKREQQR